MRRCLPLLCLPLLILAACEPASSQLHAAAAGKVQAHTIPEPGPSEFRLDGPWQFHLGDNPAWKSPSFDDSGWEQLTADEPWGMQGHPNIDGFAWYRCRLDIAPGQNLPGENSREALAILMPRVEDAYELYWNGQLIGGDGKLPPHPVWHFALMPRTFELGPARPGLLAVRVWKAPFFSYEPGLQGGFGAPPVVGSSLAVARALTALDYRRLRGRQLFYALNLLYALVAVLGLIAWGRDRSQWVTFWMVGFAIVKPLSLLLLDGSLPITTMYVFYAPLYGFGDISLWFLLLWLLDLHADTRLLRWTKSLAIAYLVAQSVEGLNALGFASNTPAPYQRADLGLQLVCIAFEFFSIVLIAIAVVRRQRLKPARWSVGFFAFFSQTIITASYALDKGSRFTHWTLWEKLLAPLFTVFGNRVTAPDIFNTLLLVSIVYAVYQASIEGRRRQIVLEHEFMSARELQQALIPATQPVVSGFALTSAYRPAMEVGGDFFQIIPIRGSEVNAGSTLILLGDVSGKGLKAAMTVSLIVGAARMLSEFTTSPAEILAGLNRRLLGQLQGGFATCIALRLHDDGRCEASSAGQPAPFLNDSEIDLPGALPLGLFVTASYEEFIIHLDPGDQLSLYTDGLLEARNSAGELYSFERLKTLFATRPTAEQATEAAVAFGQDDDITVLTLRRGSDATS